MAPLHDVLSIDGNRYVFQRLRPPIESRRAIAFSGAGASAGLYPLWPELVNLLIGEVVKRGLASDADQACRGANAVTNSVLSDSHIVSCFDPERVDK
jgi:hypothetical protein